MHQSCPRVVSSWLKPFLTARLIILVGGFFAPPGAWAGWTAAPDDPLGASCAIRSDTEQMSDGYRETPAYLLVTPDAVVARTDSPLDDSFADVGIQVDEEDFLPMDRVLERQSAMFTSGYDELVAQFKKGKIARVQLRFWPTWPATGTHSASFSLIGFTKAYDEIVGACRSDG